MSHPDDSCWRRPADPVHEHEVATLPVGPLEGQVVVTEEGEYRKLQEASRRRRRRKWQLRFLWLILTLIVGVVGTAAGAYIEKRLTPAPPPLPTSAPQGNHNFQPQDVEEGRFLAALRPATNDEMYGLSQVISANLPGFTVPRQFYVAKRDLVLPDKPLHEPIIIGMPPQYHWTGGQLNNIVLVIAKPYYDQTAVQFDAGSVAIDWMCAGMFVGPCGTAQEHRIPLKLDPNMVKLTKDQAGVQDVRTIWSSLQSQGFPVNQDDVYMITKPATLKADINDGTTMPVVIVDMDKGGRIVGGHLGNFVLVVIDGGVTQEFVDPVYLNPNLYCLYLNAAVSAEYPGACH